MLSRARRTAENGFGLPSQIFRVFYSFIALKPEITDHLVLSACYLHNILRSRYIENTSKYYYNFDHNETEPTENMMALVRSGVYANFEGFLVRDEFKIFSTVNKELFNKQKINKINKIDKLWLTVERLVRYDCLQSDRSLRAAAAV